MDQNEQERYSVLSNLVPDPVRSIGEQNPTPLELFDRKLPAPNTDSLDANQLRGALQQFLIE